MQIKEPHKAISADLHEEAYRNKRIEQMETFDQFLWTETGHFFYKVTSAQVRSLMSCLIALSQLRELMANINLRYTTW